MIRIHKSKNAPDILLKKGVADKLVLCQRYEIDPDRYNERAIPLNTNREIYAAETVKQQLIADQHGKCCFCEADFTANSFGDVEHFRPKGGYNATYNDRKLRRPGFTG